MAKVTINPSEEIIATAASEITVTDSRGRVITLKKPNILAQYRLVKVLGNAASNDVYRAMCIPLLYVAAIDDEQIAKPNSEREMEALIQRLDEDGLTAVTNGIQQNFSSVQSEEAEKEEVKKS